MKINDRILDVYGNTGIVSEIKYNVETNFPIGVLFDNQKELFWMPEYELVKIEPKQYEQCPTCFKQSLKNTSEGVRWCCSPDCGDEN